MPLTIHARAANALEIPADLLVFGVYAAGGGGAKKPTGHAEAKKPAALPPALKDLDAALGGGLAKLVAKEEFTGKRDQTLSVATLGRMPFDRVVVVGLGDRGKVSDADARAFAGKAARAANSDKARTMVLAVPAGLETKVRQLAEGLELGAYRFTKYLTGDRKPKTELAEVTIAAAGKLRPDAKKAIELGQKVAEGVNTARNLSNEPGNALPPPALASEAQKMAKAHGVHIQVFDHKEILKRGMKLIDAVGRGSAHEPRFVHMSYSPGKKAKKKLVFVGKGVTFDSGGISIKPAAGMGDMKHDMSGAGNMVGLMQAVSALKPKNVEVHAIIAAAENMPDGNAYRPGDVWGSLDGKTVEIINTDAEGRLCLADALAYARDLGPDLLVDNATLTGACVVALGNTCSGFYASNDSTAAEFTAAAKQAGEQMWRMPLLEDLRDQIKSEVADVKQTGDRYGGSITAALFLREFIGDTKNWVHADIAGPVTADRPTGWTQAKGATGHAVLTFVSLIERADR